MSQAQAHKHTQGTTTTVCKFNHAFLGIQKSETDSPRDSKRAIDAREDNVPTGVGDSPVFFWINGFVILGAKCNLAAFNKDTPRVATVGNKVVCWRNERYNRCRARFLLRAVLEDELIEGHKAGNDAFLNFLNGSVLLSGNDQLLENWCGEDVIKKVFGAQLRDTGARVTIKDTEVAPRLQLPRKRSLSYMGVLHFHSPALHAGDAIGNIIALSRIGGFSGIRFVQKGSHLLNNLLEIQNRQVVT